MLLAEIESVAEPNDASVTKIFLEFGSSVTPKRTAVPAGELRISDVETVPLDMAKDERKPVLLTVGLPLTVVRRAVESVLKKTCDTVFNGTVGGVV